METKSAVDGIQAYTSKMRRSRPLGGMSDFSFSIFFFFSFSSFFIMISMIFDVDAERKKMIKIKGKAAHGWV